jgi:excisionase family DNA binding protein
MNAIQTPEPNGAGKTWKTKREISLHLRCSVRTVTNLMKRRILPFVKIGKIVRFDTAACDTAMEKLQSRSIFDREMG